MKSAHVVTAEQAATLQRYARVAGVAMALSVVFGFLGEMYLPEKIVVARDAAATAANILNHPMLFRLTFASYLVEGLCDVALVAFFYILLEPVNRNLALISAFFGIASMVIFAVSRCSFYAASIIVSDSSGMAAFTSDQRNALALLAMRIAGTIAWLFLSLYGIATMIRGYLVTLSRYLPKTLGVLFMIGGAGFIIRSTTYLLAPAYSTGVLLLPMAAAGISMTLWLLVRGINTARAAGITTNSPTRDFPRSSAHR